MKQYQQEDQDFSNFSEVLMVCTNNKFKVNFELGLTTNVLDYCWNSCFCCCTVLWEMYILIIFCLGNS